MSVIVEIIFSIAAILLVTPTTILVIVYAKGFKIKVFDIRFEKASIFAPGFPYFAGI